MLSNIDAKMPAVVRDTSNFHKSHSQFMQVTLDVTAITPIRSIKHTLAEIDRTRAALQEAYINMRKKQVEMKKKQAATETTSADGTSTTSADSAESAIKPTDQPAASSASTTTSPAQKPATTVKKPEYSYASKVPGKEGFVFSPYNNKVVDVRDIPSGTLVQDPTYPAAEKKYFRVP
jgi:hypothetical protein